MSHKCAKWVPGCFGAEASPDMSIIITTTAGQRGLNGVHLDSRDNSSKVARITFRRKCTLCL